ncbi:MAG: Chemotaxis protein CheA [Promethearchaeota archaeon]|nr:MAG: Chemotaxis protein CheA [Candidatus Lokiarchaeota archaeon]
MSSKKDKEMKLFIDEAEELVNKVEKNILDLEENFKDDDPIQNLYFAFHTLKGSTAMVGFDRFSKFCHIFENFLDENKKYNKRKDKKDEYINLLFESHDVIRNLVNSIKKGNEKDLDAQVLQEIEETFKDYKADKKSEYDITFYKPISPEKLKEKKENYNFYKIAIEIQATCVFKKVRLFIIFRALNEIGRICSSNPSPDKLEKGNFDNDFEIYFMTKETKDKIAATIDEILEIESREIEEISSNEFYSYVEEFSAEKAASEPQKTNQAEETFETGISSIIDDDFGEELSTITSVKVDIETLERLMDYFGELVILKNQISQQLKETRGREETRVFDNMDKLFLEIQEIVFRLKLVRVEKTFRRYRRLVRDVAKDTGKKIKFVLRGLDVEIDRTVLEELNSPLIHLLRNAIYHGIETPKERKRKGKDEIGTLKLITTRKAGSINITVEDNGRGLDFEGIRRKAVNNGLYTPEEAEKLTDQDLKDLIFKPGFSTLGAANQISGRGMGLAIVEEKIEELGGSINLYTTPGKGTTFSIDVPFTRAILKAQLFEVGGDLFAVPIDNIKQIYFYDREKIDYVKGVEHYKVANELVPVIRLGEYFDFSSENESSELNINNDNSKKKIAILCQKDEHNSAIFIVDKILQQMEVVIKPFKSKYSKFQSILGVAITGDGSICLIIDVINLISSLRKDLVRLVEIEQ